MLVKVRNDDPSRLSSTERTVVNWLKSWSGPHAVPGIAIVQCQDADVVVWTPQTCVVIAVHGFTERVNGTLHCAEDEPWTVDDAPAPIDGDANPLERVRQQTTELARQLRAAPGREHVPVSGLVLVVPQLGSRLKLSKGAMPPGIDVLLGDGPSSLRAYFTRLAEGAAPAWDAAQVGQALGALGFAAAATHSDLVSEGFDPPSADRTPPPPAPAPARSVPSVPVAPPGDPEPEGGSPQSGGPGAVVPGPAAVPVVNPIPGTGVQNAAGAQQLPPSSESGSTGRAAKVAGAAAAGAAAAAAAGAIFRSSSDRPPAGTERQSSGAGQGSGGEQRGIPGTGGGQGPVSGPGHGPQGPATGFASQGAATGSGGAPSGPGTPGTAQQRPGSGPAPYVPNNPAYRPTAPQQYGSRSGGLPPGAQAARPGFASAGSGRRESASPAAGAPGFPLWDNNAPQQPTTGRRRRRDLPVVAALLVVFVFLAVAATCTSGGGDSTSEQRAPGQPTTSRSTTTPTTTDPTMPSTTIAPACFPFQPGC